MADQPFRKEDLLEPDMETLPVPDLKKQPGPFSILFSNSIAAKKWGGGEKWIVTTAADLARRGHRTIVSGKAQSILLKRARAAGLETIPFDIYADYSPFKIWQTKRILQREAIDVIILNLNKDIRVAGLAARWARVPVILARNGIQLFSDKLKYRLTLGLVDGIITNSKTIRDVYESFPWMERGKTTVIYNGINPPEGVAELDLHAAFQIPGDHLVLAAIGRLADQKGFDLLIRALAEIKAQGLKCSVLVVGEGRERVALQELIERNKVQDRVRLLGFIEDPLPIIKAADYLILPSRQEGMPNVVMEAMMLETPVLAAGVNGVTELLTHQQTGYIFQSHSVAAVCEAIQFARGAGDQVRSWTRAAREVIGNYTMEKMITGVENYLQEMYVKSARGRPAGNPR